MPNAPFVPHTRRARSTWLARIRFKSIFTTSTRKLSITTLEALAAPNGAESASLQTIPGNDLALSLNDHTGLPRAAATLAGDNLALSLFAREDSADPDATVFLTPQGYPYVRFSPPPDAKFPRDLAPPAQSFAPAGELQTTIVKNRQGAEIAHVYQYGDLGAIGLLDPQGKIKALVQLVANGNASVTLNNAEGKSVVDVQLDFTGSAEVVCKPGESTGELSAA